MHALMSATRAPANHTESDSCTGTVLTPAPGPFPVGPGPDRLAPPDCWHRIRLARLPLARSLSRSLSGFGFRVSARIRVDRLLLARSLSLLLLPPFLCQSFCLSLTHSPSRPISVLLTLPCLTHSLYPSPSVSHFPAPSVALSHLPLVSVFPSHSVSFPPIPLSLFLPLSLALTHSHSLFSPYSHPYSIHVHLTHFQTAHTRTSITRTHARTHCIL